MQTKTYDVVVLLLTDNSSEVIDRSIQSILKQKFNLKQIKIVVVDNNSTDGTYEKLLKYMTKYDISVYRLDKKYIKTRLMYNANELLKYTLYKYITILNPGDILYSNYIEKCTSIMDESSSLNAKILICETDLFDNYKHTIKQTPLFEEDCKLKNKKHFMDLLLRGLGHKVQCFYRNGTISNALVELPHIVDFTDCFKKTFFLLNSDIIYIKDIFACISKTKYDDPLDDLMFRFYFIIRQKIYRDTFNNKDTVFLDCLNSQEEIFHKLSLFALQYASEALSERKPQTANNILLFAEMVYVEIINTEFYSEIKNSITN